MKDVIIREYCEKDWQQVCCIHDQARPVELQGSCDPRAFVPLAEDVSEHENFNQSYKLVACLNEEVIGFVGTNGCEVSWLYVHPEQFGKGIGRRLLQESLTIVSGQVELYLLEGNTQARRLYESEGFKDVSKFNSDNNGYPCTVLKLSN